MLICWYCCVTFAANAQACHFTTISFLYNVIINELTTVKLGHDPRKYINVLTFKEQVCTCCQCQKGLKWIPTDRLGLTFLTKEAIHDNLSQTSHIIGKDHPRALQRKLARTSKCIHTVIIIFNTNYIVLKYTRTQLSHIFPLQVITCKITLARAKRDISTNEIWL